MFEVDVAGFVELEGGKPPHRLALEPVANVFDEFRGYVEGRKKPSYCAVSLVHQNNPRGVMLTVADDGAGFASEKDIWTLFGSTAKRNNVGVAGRFNLGDKQLIAVARWARVRTNNLTVTFEDGKRDVVRHRTQEVSGTIVEALMPWSLDDMAQAREQLKGVLPPAGLVCNVDDQQILRPAIKTEVKVTLPTVRLVDGVMRPASAKTGVTVLKTSVPTLYELGLPVCELADLGFPWSLDVGQKVPVPPSRDSVSAAYLMQLIGKTIEAAAMDGIELLTQEEQGAGFIKGALDWVREAEALKVVATSLFGKDAVRQSADPVANAQAAASGATIVSGKWFSADTRRRFEEAKVLPTAKEKFGGAEALPRQPNVKMSCPNCGFAL